MISESYTIGIPTYYGGPGLVKTAKSILNSRNVGKVNLVIVVDGKPLDLEIENSLKNIGVTVLFDNERKGQVARINQMIENCTTDIIILTQDDILFDENATYEIVKIFEDKEVTMTAAKVVPLHPKTIFERIVHVGVFISQYIGNNLNNSDNYFLASGRCLAFRTQHAKKFKIPEEVINSDTYLYFLDKSLGGKFKFASKAIYYMRSPMKLGDHLKQSGKYQYVNDEMKHYFNLDIDKVQPIPTSLKVRAFVSSLLTNPIFSVLYLYVLAYTRIYGRKLFKDKVRFWDTDVSTKDI